MIPDDDAKKRKPNLREHSLLHLQERRGCSINKKNTGAFFYFLHTNVHVCS